MSNDQYKASNLVHPEEAIFAVTKFTCLVHFAASTVFQNDWIPLISSPFGFGLKSFVIYSSN